MKTKLATCLDYAYEQDEFKQVQQPIKQQRSSKLEHKARTMQQTILKQGTIILTQKLANKQKSHNLFTIMNSRMKFSINST